MSGLLRIIALIAGSETAHSCAIFALRLADKIPAMKWLLHKIYTVEDKSLEREVFGLHFRNPIGLAAGFDRNAEVFRPLSALGFGFVEIGTITPRPQHGNPKPRLFTLQDDNAILNRIGLANKGLDEVLANVRHEHEGIILGCNIGKNTVTPPDEAASDYLRVFRNLYQYLDYFTVNVSYNTTHKQYVPRTRESIMKILDPLFDFRRGQNQYRPILLKISPDLSNEEIDLMTDIMVDTPLDGIIATNATTHPQNLKTNSSTLRKYGNGAVSGEPLSARAVEVVRRVYQRCNGTYPIIGVGGIMSAEEVKAMFEAGATLVQVYTGLIYNGAGFAGDLCRSLLETKSPQKEDNEIEETSAE
ncbi:MAG: quinone-dependent dihydroorotate dehydrogenase [Alistipes sp.]|nr:quinone-dependent dihydroorotate dehydrogenase [Alistipes sp.]